MQELKSKIQNSIGEMNGELSQYEGGYKQCLINIQNDIDDFLLNFEKEVMTQCYLSADKFPRKHEFEKWYEKNYGQK